LVTRAWAFLFYRFFAQFPNCLIYRDHDEFKRCLRHALESNPQPLSQQQLAALTWEAATERFLDVAELKQPVQAHERALDNFLAGLHNSLTGVEKLRVAAGAGVGTRDNPRRVTDYVPCEEDVGGLFDDAKRAKKAYAKGKQQPQLQQQVQQQVPEPPQQQQLQPLSLARPLPEQQQPLVVSTKA
jgi:digalactosyldiacylglycerol synthase